MKKCVCWLFALMLFAPVAWSVDSDGQNMQGSVTSVAAGKVVIDGKTFQLMDSTRLLGVSSTEIRGTAIPRQLPIRSEVIYATDSKRPSYLTYIRVIVK